MMMLEVGSINVFNFLLYYYYDIDMIIGELMVYLELKFYIDWGNLIFDFELVVDYLGISFK